MHVAIVDGDVSYPATSGKRLRTLNLLLPLAQRHQLTYIGRCAPGSVEMREAPTFLRDHGIEPILVPDPVARKSGLGFYARLAGNLFSSEPYSVASHQSPAMAQAVADFARIHSVDLWQFEWSAYLPTLERRVQAPRLLIAHNVDALIWQRYYENEARPLQRWYLKGQWQKFVKFEERAFRQADRVVAVSADDAERIRNDFGQPEVDVVDNGFDRAFFDQAKGTRDPRALLFLGALDWRPNLDAVNLLLERIFPDVRRQTPDAKLWIVGRNPSEGLRNRIAQTPGVELFADVPDVRKFLAEAALMAVPLRIGGGSRLKILEALGCKLPVVSTRVGAEGLDLVPGEHYVQSEEADMAAALVHGLQEPERMRRLAQQGYERVIGQYDWPMLARKLEQSWETCLQRFHAKGASPCASSI